MALESLGTHAADAAVGALATGAVGASTSAIKAFLSRRPGSTDGGTTAERAAAAAAFRHAVIDFRITMALLAGLRVRLVGAAITLPLIVKHLHRLPSLSAALSNTALELCTVGTHPVIEQADAVVVALSHAAHEYSKAPTRTRNQRVMLALAHVDQALGDFTRTVRTDCGHSPVPPITTS